MAQTSFDREDAEAFLTEMQNLRQTLQQEWARVLNRWSNLKAVWHDDQFDRFEPVFERVSAAYLEAEQDCEQYIAFLKEQIRLDGERQAKLNRQIGGFVEKVKTVGTGVQLFTALVAPNASAPNPTDPNITTPQTPPYSQVQEQEPTSCPLDRSESSKEAIQDYNALPRIARSPNTEEQLQVITESDGKDASKKRQEDIETSILADRDSDAAAFSDRPPMPPA